jgi:hypothetical protein
VTTRTLRPAPTVCNRNGTFIRVLLVDPPGLPEHVCVEDVDVHLHRILVVIAPNLDALDAQTGALQNAAAAEGISLISADGYHEALLDRIAASNRGSK